MKYIVTINNKQYEVEVEKGQAAVTGVKEFSPAAAAAPMPAEAAAPAKSPATAATASAQHAPEPAPQSAPQPAGNTVNGDAVKSPMPGTILDVKTNAGSKVKKGDVLFILEAMKMENEIVAPRDATVAEIRTAKGASVSTGDLLAVLQ